MVGSDVIFSLDTSHVFFTGNPMAKKKTEGNSKTRTSRPRNKSRVADSTGSVNASSTPKRKSARHGEEPNFRIVGIGASAGGLEAFEQFFTNMPPDTGMAFVLVQHLDPTHKSILSDLVKGYTRMSVVEVEDGMAVKPDSIYVIRPNCDMAILNEKLHLFEPSAPRGLRQPIDFFFRSLAADQKERAIGVVLSGTGTEGAMGLRAIKGEGGMAMAQDPATARYDGMPKSAVATGLVDYVLPPAKMPEQLIAYVQHLPVPKLQETAGLPSESTDLLEKILVQVRMQTGHDFSHYKRSTLLRRIERRMAVNQIAKRSDYVRYIGNYPEEARTLFKEFLIGVTNFFRDTGAFEALREKVIPRLFRNGTKNNAVRIWVPACATGEEAFSVAILVREYMDELKGRFSVQIFGTDIDVKAIEAARAAVYPDSIAVDVSPGRLKRFFVQEGNYYRIKKDVREMAVFAVQNIIADPPFSKLDLVSCRNLLIYLGPELQKKLIPALHYALKPGGFLFLGTSETVGTFTDLFASVDRKWKLYQRIETGYRGRPGVEMSAYPEADVGRGALEVVTTTRMTLGDVAGKAILENYAATGVLINERHEVVYFYGSTSKYLQPPSGDANWNILGMAKKGLKLELANAIRKAGTHVQTVRRERMHVKIDGHDQLITLTVKPILEPPARRGLLMVVFEEIQPQEIHPPNESISNEAEGDLSIRIRQLEEDLASTKEYLQTTIEELETSNEEMKSTNEELQSANEELQSTNEELETSKEEQQSVNEELVTVNVELQEKINELSKVNDDLNNFLASTQIGTIFLDKGLIIRRFTPAVTSIIKLIHTDVGRPVSDISSNLEYDRLVEDLEEVLQTLVLREIEVQAKDSRWYLMRIRPYRTTENLIDGIVLSFVDITQQKDVQEALDDSRQYFESIVDTVRDPMLVLDDSLTVIYANRSFYGTFAVNPPRTEGKKIYDLGNRQWDIPGLRELLEKILPEEKQIRDFEMEHDFETIGRRKILLNARKLEGKSAAAPRILLAIEDVTGRKGGNTTSRPRK
jgi:two-component system, chemotaxis family, CheB/CheR fusion protein